MNDAITLQSIKKKYGKKEVLTDISCHIQKGKIVGVLGPNSSGKTTLMKLLAGLIHWDFGVVNIGEEKLSNKTKSFISFLPDCNILYPNMTIKAAIGFYDQMYDDFDKNRAGELLTLMELDSKVKIKALSKGMAERLLVLLTLSRNAKIYLLDEPFDRCDLIIKERILDVLLKHHNEFQSTILLSTHNIHNMSCIFDQVLFLKNGKIQLDANCDDLLEEKGMSLEEIYREVYDHA